MNLADLIEMSNREGRTPDEQGFIEGLRELLESHVIIPHGENRHPYADVWHEWVEDLSKELQWKDGEWCRSAANDNYDTQLRIKPSEPIYEYERDESTKRIRP